MVHLLWLTLNYKYDVCLKYLTPMWYREKFDDVYNMKCDINVTSDQFNLVTIYDQAKLSYII